MLAAGLIGIDIIPAVVVEGILAQRLSHDIYRLPLGYPGSQLIHHFLRNDIALMDVEVINEWQPF
jgi:hypothetical protein